MVAALTAGRQTASREATAVVARILHRYQKSVEAVKNVISQLILLSGRAEVLGTG